MSSDNINSQNSLDVLDITNKILNTLPLLLIDEKKENAFIVISQNINILINGIRSEEDHKLFFETYKKVVNFAKKNNLKELEFNCDQWGKDFLVKRDKNLYSLLLDEKSNQKIYSYIYNDMRLLAKDIKCEEDYNRFLGFFNSFVDFCNQNRLFGFKNHCLVLGRSAEEKFSNLNNGKNNKFTYYINLLQDIEKDINKTGMIDFDLLMETCRRRLANIKSEILSNNVNYLSDQQVKYILDKISELYNNIEQNVDKVNEILDDKFYY